MTSLSRLVVIIGPTASGKSALGIHLARQLDGEILVCDSAQVYRHFDIGTAKTPVAEQGDISHHLVDLCEPDEVFTAGEFRLQALRALNDLRNREKLPILTAGTGLYLRALLEGLNEAPARSEALRERLREKSKLHGPDHLHRVLARLDKTASENISARDEQKIIRAIEMRTITGKSVTEIHGSARPGLEGYDILKIGLRPARAALYSRIDARVESMIHSGWIEEVRRLIASGVAPDSKPFQFIGYPQLRAHLQAGAPLGAAIKDIQQCTRQFAKRQITWFRKEKNVHWLSGFGDDPRIATAALALTKSVTLNS